MFFIFLMSSTAQLICVAAMIQAKSNDGSYIKTVF